MPDDVSAVLNLPYIQPSQAQKHVTHNEALRLLDVLVQLVDTDRSLTVPPAAPGAGARYIVAAGAGGPWAGQEGAIARHEAGGWQFFAPQPGWSAYVLAEAVTVVFDGVQWRAPVEEPQLFSELGINTSADATNRLAVAAAATLFSHVGDGHQMKINKAGPGAGAAEIGGGTGPRLCHRWHPARTAERQCPVGAAGGHGGDAGHHRHHGGAAAENRGFRAGRADPAGQRPVLFQFHSQQYIGQQLPGFLGGALLNLRRSLTNWTQIFCTYVGSGHGQMFFRS